MKRLEKIKKLEKELDAAAKKNDELRGQNTELHKICRQQRDSLAAQQEAIVHLNTVMNSTLAAITEKHGIGSKKEDGAEVRRISFGVDAYNSVLEHNHVSVDVVDGEYIVTLEEIPEETEDGDDGEL